MSTNYYLVDSEEEDYWKGIFLGKKSGGWVPQFKWHRKNFCSCDCPNGTHNYRNWEELKSFLYRGFIKDEYGEMYTPSEFIKMMEGWKEKNDNKPKEGAKTWKIDGWWFVRGNWS